MFGWLHRRTRFAGALTLSVLFLTSPAANAQDALVPPQSAPAATRDSSPVKPDAPDPTFEIILQREALRTSKAVRAYITNHPDAEDYSSACLWLMNDAREHGIEEQVATIAESIINQPSLDSSIRQAAFEVSCLATAKSGKIEQAVDEYKQLLKSIRLNDYESSIAFAQSLSAQAQMANRPDMANKIFESLSTAFFLNSFVREFCIRQIDKYKMYGTTPPQIVANDVNGRLFDLQNSRGQVVLVDFWATNCPPCLVEFPRFNSLYSKYHGRGLQILGVSLDDNSAVVTDYSKRMGLKWPMVMNNSLTPRATTQFKVKMIPSLFLIDRQGRVAGVDIRGADLEPAIVRLLERTSKNINRQSE